MFFGLGHGAVGAGDDEDSTVHLGGAGDHVFDIIGVAGAVDVGVVAGFGLILHGGSVNCDATSALFRSGVDFVVLFGGTVAEGG